MNANHIQLFLASLFSILISSACSSDDVEKELPEPVTKGVAVEINTEVQTRQSPLLIIIMERDDHHIKGVQ